ncbi:hypothetical protein [Falsiphaeobacter marinintestinus]|uniref:hypothetical protein n=1 Tax=Falsiphaeobacter marinintestinus TaxID=1492905 RepID=UPI0011B67B14|nr:hypothetical protein [Phaeobacter marinintestinus]
MKRVTLAACCLILPTFVAPVFAETTTDEQVRNYDVAQNAHGQKNPNRKNKKKKNDGVNVGVSNNGVSVGVRNDGTSVRMGPSGPSVSTRTNSGVRLSISANGRVGIGF